MIPRKASVLERPQDPDEHLIPVSVVTGFLGSGKTTLISRIILDPAFARTAIIVNEFGEIGLDHDLIADGDEAVVALSTGCFCCVSKTNINRTLLDLLQRRQAGSVVYDRVLIETSGLSDPATMLQGLMTDSGVFATYQMPYVVTLVDTVHGEASLDQYAEARHQVAFADRVLFSKTDLQPASDQLIARVDGLNADASCLPTMIAEPSTVFGDPSIALLTERLARTPRRTVHSGINTFTLVRDRPLPALALTMLLQAMAEHCGHRMLRLKGLVAIHEMPGRPAVIHGVRHVVSAPSFLDCWPSVEGTRIVFITMGVPEHFAARLLDAIEEEVLDTIA